MFGLMHFDEGNIYEYIIYAQVYCCMKLLLNLYYLIYIYFTIKI